MIYSFKLLLHQGLELLFHASYNTNVSAYHNIVAYLIQKHRQRYFLLYNVGFLDTKSKIPIHHHHQRQRSQTLRHDLPALLNQENYTLL